MKMFKNYYDTNFDYSARCFRNKNILPKRTYRWLKFRVGNTIHDQRYAKNILSRKIGPRQKVISIRYKTAAYLSSGWRKWKRNQRRPQQKKMKSGDTERNKQGLKGGRNTKYCSGSDWGHARD